MNATTAGTPAVEAARRNGAAALELRNIHTFYGHIHAIKGISLRVQPREIVTLIGANGAGKTTTLRTISGINPPRLGEVLLNGQRIDRVPPHRIVEMGVCQSPEGRRCADFGSQDDQGTGRWRYPGSSTRLSARSWRAMSRPMPARNTGYSRRGAPRRA